MFYLVETRFCAGIYLSRAAIEINLQNARPQIKEYAEYPEVERKLRELETDFSIPWKEFRFNRLYKIRDNRIYVVVYTRERAGFIDVENLSNFLNHYKIDILSCKMSSKMTYQKAVQMTWNMGVYTGRDICGPKSPVCWRYYKRKSGNAGRVRR